MTKFFVAGLPRRFEMHVPGTHIVNVPKMAATHFLVSAILGIISLCFHLCLPDINFRFYKDTFNLSTTFYGLPRIVETADSRINFTYPIHTWHKQGLLFIAICLWKWTWRYTWMLNLILVWLRFLWLGQHTVNTLSIKDNVHVFKVFYFNDDESSLL